MNSESDRLEYTPKQKAKFKDIAGTYWVVGAVLAVVGGFLGLFEIQFGWGLMAFAALIPGFIGLLYWLSAQ